MKFTDYLKSKETINESRVINVDLHELTTKQQKEFEKMYLKLKYVDHKLSTDKVNCEVYQPWNSDGTFVVKVKDNYDMKDLVQAYYEQYAKQLLLDTLNDEYYETHDDEIRDLILQIEDE